MKVLKARLNDLKENVKKTELSAISERKKHTISQVLLRRKKANKQEKEQEKEVSFKPKMGQQLFHFFIFSL